MSDVKKATQQLQRLSRQLQLLHDQMSLPIFLKYKPRVMRLIKMLDKDTLELLDNFKND